MSVVWGGLFGRALPIHRWPRVVDTPARLSALCLWICSRYSRNVCILVSAAKIFPILNVMSNWRKWTINLVFIINDVVNNPVYKKVPGSLNLNEYRTGAVFLWTVHNKTARRGFSESFSAIFHQKLVKYYIFFSLIVVLNYIQKFALC